MYTEAYAERCFNTCTHTFTLSAFSQQFHGCVEPPRCLPFDSMSLQDRSDQGEGCLLSIVLLWIFLCDVFVHNLRLWEPKP